MSNTNCSATKLTREQVKATKGKIFSILYKCSDKREKDGSITKGKIEKYDVRIGVTKGLKEPMSDYSQKPQKPINEDLLVVWCMKRNGWRSFRMEQILDSSLLHK